MLNEQQVHQLQEADLDVRTKKADYDHARAEREKLIRQASKDGAGYREISDFAGVSYQRVAQIVSGGGPPTRKPDDNLDFECPTCGAAVGQRCEGKGYRSAHGARSLLAIKAFEARHPEVV